MTYREPLSESDRARGAGNATTSVGQRGAGGASADRARGAGNAGGALRPQHGTMLDGDSVSTVERTRELDVPVSTAYNQWTQFEDFPRFMEGVVRVNQIDDTHLHWCANIGGVEREWKAAIIEQEPDQCIAWESISGARNAGRVTFESLAPGRCRVTVRMHYTPEGATETIGDWLGIIGSRVDGDLDRFKHFIEQRGSATGAWRGRV